MLEFVTINAAFYRRATVFKKFIAVYVIKILLCTSDEASSKK